MASARSSVSGDAVACALAGLADATARFAFCVALARDRMVLGRRSGAAHRDDDTLPFTVQPC